MTRTIAFDDYFGPGTVAPSDVVDNYARKHSIEPEVLWAVAAVESPKGPFLPDGRPYILFEAHWFGKLTNYRYNDSHPGISTRGWKGPGTYGPAGTHQWTRFHQASQLDEAAAIQSASWGRFQIMGFHYKMLGYSSPQEFARAMVQSEANQFQAFFRFLESKGIIPALQAKEWDQIAYRYNGSGYRRNNYHVKMKNAYNALTSNILRRGMKTPRVTTLQKLLRKHGYGVDVDGYFGPSTESAVKEYQRARGLTIDGIVGPQTLKDMAAKRIEQTPKSKSKRVAGGVTQATAGAGALITGALTQAEDISDKVQRVKQLADENPAVLEVAQQAQDLNYASMALMAAGVIMLALAGYFIWTKFYDDNKAQGVED